MIKINEIKLPLEVPDDELFAIAAKKLGIPRQDVKNVTLLKKAIDSRKKENIFFVCNIAVEINGDEAAAVRRASDSKITLYEKKEYEMPACRRKSGLRPVIVGFGPAGFFAGLTLARAGLRPLIIERGADVDERAKHVASFWQTGKLNTESNIQFGEGGAGTFSDGKLTTGIKDSLCTKVIEEFVAHGAPEEILYSATPHIGTDRLPSVIKSIREEIISLGGEVRFNTLLTDIIIANGSVQGVSYTSGGVSEDFETDTLLLCIGHSSRDTLEMLYRKGFNMIQKPFSVGARIEHPREFIDKAQFGAFAGHPKLGAAVYKLACHPPGGRGAYTFCMCPGGTVVCASSEENECVVNGMSEYARDGRNSNSAVLVGVEPEDFGSPHPLAGIELQRRIEKKAFESAGSDYSCPAQTVGDFLAGRASLKLGCVEPTCPTGVTPGDIRNILPARVCSVMSDALGKMDRMLTGFAMADAVLTAPETRSSSPVRILRSDILQSNIRGVYPCGEGAGYAGGIVSSGVDGIRCAHAVLLDENDDCI